MQIISSSQSHTSPSLLDSEASASGFDAWHRGVEEPFAPLSENREPASGGFLAFCASLCTSENVALVTLILVTLTIALFISAITGGPTPRT